TGQGFSTSVQLFPRIIRLISTPDACCFLKGYLMTTVRSALSRSCLGILTAAALVLTSCAAQNPTDFDDSDSANAASSSPSANAAANGGELIAEVDDPVAFEVCQDAAQIDGATVEWLDDVVMEEQRIDGTEAQPVEVTGHQVEIPRAPDI